MLPLFPPTHLPPDLLHLLVQHILHLPVTGQLGNVVQEVADGLRAALAARQGARQAAQRGGRGALKWWRRPQAGSPPAACACSSICGACLQSAPAPAPPVTDLCTTSGWYCSPKMRRSGFSTATMAPCTAGRAAGRAECSSAQASTRPSRMMGCRDCSSSAPAHLPALRLKQLLSTHRTSRPYPPQAPHLLAARHHAEALWQFHRLVAVAHPHQLGVLVLGGKQGGVAHLRWVGTGWKRA